jgi:hypothetical protein
MRQTGLLALLGAVVTTALGACSDDPRDDAPVLEVAWTSDAGGWDGYDQVWAADDEWWVYRSHEDASLVGVDLTDGDIAWQQPSPEVCAFSAINDAGLLAVQTGSECTGLSVFDTDSGEELWSNPVRFPADTYPTAWGLSVGVSERTASVVTRCGVERYALDDGRFLGRLRAQSPRGYRAGYCGEQATTGTLALVADRSGLIGYNADTAREVWRRPGSDPAVARVYSTDPLVADVELGGVRGVRTVDPATGELGPVLGRTLPQIGQSPDVAAPTGSAVVTAYDDPPGESSGTYAQVVRSWDAATGAAEWTETGRNDDYLGADETGVYLGRTVTLDDDSGYAYWVTRRGPDGDGFETVGWVKDQVLQQTRIGDLLITGGDYGRPTTAYRLPAESVDIEPPPAESGYSGPDWAEGDLRPDPLVDPCTGVSEETLRSLGFDRVAALPAPLDCRWQEGEQSLGVGVRVSSPGDGTTAVEEASTHAAQVAASRDYVEVDGLGDEAWIWRAQQVGTTEYPEIPGTTATDVALLVRRANVVVEAAYSGPVPGYGPQWTLPRAGFRAEQAVRAAVDETLATWEGQGQPEATEPPGDAEVTALPDLCRLAARDARELLPGTAPVVLTAPGEDRLRGCRWQRGRYGDFVQVVAHAAGPSVLTGGSATEEARVIFAASVDATLATQVRGRGWDEALLEGHDHGYDDDRRLTVRAGNVVLVVQVHLEDDDGPSRAQPAATGLARRLVTALRR